MEVNTNRVRTIKLMRIEDVHPYPGNARIHTEEQVELIAESITANGFTNPIEVDEGGVIIAGHGRREAALYLGLTKVPTMTIDWLDEIQKSKLRLADNRLSELSDWDPVIMAGELMALGAADEQFEATDLGMDSGFLLKLGIGDIPTNTSPAGDPGDQYLITVQCGDEIELEELREELQERGLTIR